MYIFHHLIYHFRSIQVDKHIVEVTQIGKYILLRKNKDLFGNNFTL